MRRMALCSLLLLAASCVGEITGADDTERPSDDDAAPTADAAPPQLGADAAPIDGGHRMRYLCDQERPPGAPMPPAPPAYSGGTCPQLAAGVNQITSSGNPRQFILVLPTDLLPGERLPLGFLWHPLGSDADVYLSEGDLQAAIDSERFAAVLPQDKGDLSLRWPWTAGDSEQRITEELVFFDDMFGCVAEQFDINLDCVGNGGVSSGGLWATQVGWRRGQYFSSLMSVSGGSGGVARNWSSSPHKMATLVAWGGPSDSCSVFDFTDSSRRLESALESDGHFILECVHNCGHALPPFEVFEDQPRFAPLWEFVLNHPYWLEDGDSPYLRDGLPDGTPSWCAVGAGTATQRSGACDRPSQC